MAAPLPPLDTRYDSAIQATNDDASLSKLAAIRLGYWADPWLGHFLAARPPGATTPGSGGAPPPRRSGAHPPRRPPLINRGYYCRHLAFQWFVDTFLERVRASSGGGGGGDTTTPLLPCTILSLGAGFETTFFRLAAGGGPLPTRYVELEFAAVTRRKAATIQGVPALAAAVSAAGTATFDLEAGAVASPVYTLAPVDLRDAAGVVGALDALGLDPAAPTLILAECVFAYLPAPAGAALVAALGARFPATAACAVYDPIRPDDAFGTQMAANLAARGCPLVGVAGAPTPGAQASRFTAGGAWGRAAAADLREVWAARTPAAAHAAADRIERLDEVEEWHLILEHYGLAVGVNDGEGVLAGFGLPPLVERVGAVPGRRA